MGDRAMSKIEWRHHILDLMERAAVVAIVVGLAVLVPDWWRAAQTQKLLAENEVGTYLTVQRVDVGSSVVGQHVFLDVDRTIHREFRGTYLVEVRRFPSREVVCVAGDSLVYRPDGSLPDIITLEWWANDGECSGPDLSVGEYIIVTTWTIHTEIPGVPDRSLTVESNPFEISAIDPDAASRAIQEQGEVLDRVQQLEQQIEQITGSDK